ncbi:MAG: hypothetical protein E6Q28_09855 [Afipia sp.]|nr:MAG: hypothetical protein E6Q28_09855 [Afipia sp.]
MSKFQDALSYPPRMMNADRSAAYVDLSKTKFLEGVQNGTWPAAKDVGGVFRWDRQELDAAVDAFSARKRKSATQPMTLAEALEAEDGQGGSAVRQ